MAANVHVQKPTWKYALAVALILIILLTMTYVRNFEQSVKFVREEQTNSSSFTFIKRYWSLITESKSAEVNCTPNEPCRYPESVDYRIIVITYNRAQSLTKLLTSLDTVLLDGDRGRLEIWIDRNTTGGVHAETLQAATSFKWSKGPTRVHVQKRHVGIGGQWIDTWTPPDGGRTELATILEDDLSVSPFIYRWTKAVHQYYGSRKDFGGSTLQSDQQNSHVVKSIPLKGPRHHTAYLYKCIGTWGFTPEPSHWKKFQEWYHKVARPDPKFHPYVPGPVTTEWYQYFERVGRAASMWEQWYIYYAHKERLYTVYNNLPVFNDDKKSCLSINRREVGLHFDKKGREDLCELIKTWKPEYVTFPGGNETWTLDWSGLPIAKY